MPLLLNTASNVVGLGLPALAALFVLPDLLANLGLVSFGRFSLQLTVLYFFGVADFGIARTIVLMSSGERAGASVAWIRPYLVGSYFNRLLSIGVLAVGVLTAAAIFFLYSEVDLVLSTAITFIAAALSLLSLPPRAAMELQDRFALMNVLRGASSATVFMAPYFVAKHDTSLTALAISIAATRLVFFVAFLWACGGLKLWFEGSAQAMRSELGASKRQFAHKLGWVGITNTVSPLLGYLDRAFVGLLLSAGAVAHYVLGQELASKVSLLVGAATSAALPRLAYARDAGRSRSLGAVVRQMAALVISLGLIPSLCLIAFGQEILQLWLDQSYQPATLLPMQILAVGVGINSLSQVNFSLLQVLGGEKDGAFLQLIQLPIVLTLLGALVPVFGITGAAIAISARLLVDGLVLRWMLVRRSSASAPGFTYTHLLLTTVLGVVVVFLSMGSEKDGSPS